MQADSMVSNVDPRFEDAEKLNELSRRGFFNRMIGGTAAGASRSPRGDTGLVIQIF